MTYKANLKVQYDTEWLPSYYGKDEEMLPEQHYTFEIPVHDINVTQLFRFFGDIAMAMGHNDINIMKGACALAFNEMRSQEDMRKVAEEYDLFLAEDMEKEVQERVQCIKEHNSDVLNYDNNAMYWKNKYIEELTKQGRMDDLHQPQSHQYTEEELDAMCDAAANQQERERCREYNRREAEYYDKRARLDLQQQVDLIGLGKIDEL